MINSSMTSLEMTMNFRITKLYSDFFYIMRTIILVNTMKKLNKYNKKRDFKKTSEPMGNTSKSTKRLRFVVQHHIARRDHYDFRLELDGVLLSWAVPKGPSYNTKDKRLAVHVEDHPLTYRNFEGTIPKGEYGGGTVMIWDEGFYIPLENIKSTYKKGYIKFELKGHRLKGNWTLIHFKEDNWFLIKESDGIKLFDDINEFNTSIKTLRTMDEITAGIKKHREKLEIKITNPNKLIYKDVNIKKIDVVNYYEKIYKRMRPFINNRIISTVRVPNGISGEKFFKKHFEINKYLNKIYVKNKHGNKEDYYYINDLNGLISEAQMNSIEYHISSANTNDLKHPNILFFDLDPDEGLDISKVREGVKDLKSILDSLDLQSYLKTSGGKGYHVFVPLSIKVTWKKLAKIASDIAKLMEEKWPEKYTSNIRKNSRKGKIFIDWVRNTEGASCIAPYSLRARPGAKVSMPIKWSELDKVSPDGIDIKEAIRRLKRKDPWEDFFKQI